MALAFVARRSAQPTGRNAASTFESLQMKIRFRARGDLLDSVRADLHRAHPFAGEHVGFLLCGAGQIEDGGLVVLAGGYHAVEDDDYLRDDDVGAMMGPAAIRKAMQRAYKNGGAQDVALFHVHMHDHLGLPGFSKVDVDEYMKFVPDFSTRYR